ncbi:chemotaxis protein CheA [Clostridium beijerinckii]|uniref:Chemotaxis protein CheA n=1 Tax=Clostridium beijerinckii TaxID=1520 RepID=A0AAX0B998_CLOBE|nr:chemotaxis protein CheA [Clostridium beijerinckii]NRT91741.1 two-component system chemotaxis sensor kinase CheA [Clostridium beijerinckii]NYC71268.1 two-component system chemotaxis sensor kinase CheA [Clostridium beijerinckii]
MDTREPMLEMFIFETLDMIEQLQQLIIDGEKNERLETEAINEIFRIMHTIKGSSGMMMFDNISNLSHTIEDLFYFIRESKPEKIDYSKLTDLVLEGSDLIKIETEKINNDKEADGDFTLFIEKVKGFLKLLKTCDENSEDSGNGGSDELVSEEDVEQKYYLSTDRVNSNLNLFSATLFFDEECDMENIRCFTVVHQLKEISEVSYYYPEDIIENNDTCEIIKKQGFKIFFKTNQSIEDIRTLLMENAFLNNVDINKFYSEIEFSEQFSEKNEKPQEDIIKSINNIVNDTNGSEKVASKSLSYKQSLISVDVKKLDKLMDLVGELVISEAMVTKNPEISELQLDSFNKAARQHRKRLSDLQDVVMSIRMVSLAPTLTKMNRIVRDMCKKLNKEVELEIIGQETEVDKNIIEHIGDPLMHIVRNSMDHGIETKEERLANGKPSIGKITIEAKNTGGEVWIIIKDNGKGLNKDKILKKAKDNGLLKVKENDLTDRDIYSMIFLPGFSTKENVTEFSGRGVGMDVVTKEIEKIRGIVTVDSIPGEETTTSIKIPLTLAIIDGMTIKVGKSAFTIPVTSIRQSFIIKKEDIIRDIDNNEMILIRGECYSILKLHEFYNIKTNVVNIEDGIVIMVEDQGKAKCIFADELIGEQQVVIKALPEYIKKVKAISGCSLLGDATISLILDISEIVNL